MNANSSSGEDDAKPILLFDGVCHLCDRGVQFVLRHDRHATFRFAPLQSAAAQSLMRQHGLAPESLDSMVLIEGGQAYRKSTAVLRIARRLSYPWRLAALLLVVPSCLRDPLYAFVASRRYRWFGKAETCSLPSPEWKNRFLP